MEFEDILFELGDSGRYQKNLILLFLVPSATLLPWFSMNVLFMLSVPDHWCNVPEVASSNLTIEQQRNLISPSSSPKCYMYDVNYTEYLESGIYSVPNDTTTRPCNDGWQYDKTNYESTAATQWNMFCDDAHYISFVLTLFNVGSIIFTPIYGSLSDRIGRKITFFITLLITTVSALASVYMTDFTAFVVIKTINGGLMPSVFQLPYIIILEVVAPEMRTHMNGLVNCAWTVGMCFLPLIAYFSRDWVTLGLVTSSVTVLFFLYWTFLPESPRWLLSQEKYDEALVILKKIGETNGKVVNEEQLLAKIKTLGEKIKKEKTVDNVENSSMDLLRYPKLRKTFIIISVCWVSDVMAYYGLQINVSNLAGNEFVNFFLTAIVEIPGYVTSWILMDKFGRRWCTVGGFLTTGIVCMLPALVSGLPYADITCSMIGKFCAAATFMATYQQSSELYPTVVRSLGMGMSSTVSMTISLCVPYLVYLSVHGKAIPFVVIGIVAIIAGILAAFLPETLNENLPQTISDAEEFGKNQKFFSWNRRRRSITRERAASLALQLKGFDNAGMNDEKDTKEKPKSQILPYGNFSTNGNILARAEKKEKSVSPALSEKSLNNINKEKSVSPVLNERSPSNINKESSVSPVLSERSPSNIQKEKSVPPVFSERSPSNINKENSASPVLSERSPSNIHKENSVSPVLSDRSPNNIRKENSESPILSDKSLNSDTNKCVQEIPPVSFRQSFRDTGNEEISNTACDDQLADSASKQENHPAAYEQHVADELSDCGPNNMV